jgi:hypothetical protein
MSTKANAITKNAANLIAFSFWFGFSLWASFWLMMPVGWVEEKLPLAKLPERLSFTIFLLSWAGCVFSVSWILIWWTRRRRWTIAQSTGRSATFLCLLLACTVYCTTAWDKYIADNLYICTDSVPWVFVHPGDWVHGSYVIIPQVRFPRSMSEPDAVKEGWSVPKLWCLWWSWIAASVGVSALLSFLIWWPRTRKTAVIPAATCAGNAES